MAALRQDLAITVVAEGIETREELWTLQDLGIRVGQGFRLGRPTTDPVRASPASSGTARSPPIPCALTTIPFKKMRGSFRHLSSVYRPKIAESPRSPDHGADKDHGVMLPDHRRGEEGAPGRAPSPPTVAKSVAGGQ